MAANKGKESIKVSKMDDVDEKGLLDKQSSNVGPRKQL